MSNRHQLGELQLAIMRVLWDMEGATVQQVHAALEPSRALTASTIGTMLQKMERKGVVRHQRDGRRYVYHSTIDESDVRATMVGELTRRLFGGDVRALLGHLVRAEELDGGDLEGLRREIEARERQRRPEAPRSDEAGRGAGDDA